MDIAERVKRVLCAQLDVAEDAVSEDARIADDLKADSLDTVELVMALEEEFGIEIPDEDVDKIATVGGIIDYVKENSGD